MDLPGYAVDRIAVLSAAYGKALDSDQLPHNGCIGAFGVKLRPRWWSRGRGRRGWSR